MNHRLLFLTLFIFITISTFGQEPIPTSKRAARGFLSYSNYRQALEEYQKLWAKDSTNIEYNHSIGLCYIETNIDKSKAIPYLEWVVNQPKSNPNAWYDLGRAYALNYRFDDAIEAFSKYTQIIIKDENYIQASRWIEMCQNAKEFVKHPLNVTFQNLGAEINSDAPDINAYITSDETFMVFTTKRAGNVGGWLDYDGFLTSDIMYSTSKSGVWLKPRRLPNTINSAIVEETVGMSPDGSHLFVYMDNFTASGDIYLSVKTGRSFNKLEPLGRNINTKNLETSACIAPNKKIIFFTTTLPDTYGGTDIYYSSKLPNGEWGPPVNLGKTINTQYDEEFPYLAPDGKTFYFASTGHNSMGGFDIFKSVWNKEDMTFTKPVNLGYPINTPENNFTFSITRSGRYAYVSAFRKEGYGDLDIYRVILNNVAAPMHFISGNILHPDSSDFFSNHNTLRQELLNMNMILDTMNFTPVTEDSARVEAAHPGFFIHFLKLQNDVAHFPDITINVTKPESDNIIGIYRPDKTSGRYVIILPPGKYNLTCKAHGYTPFVKTVDLPDYESYNEEMTIDIVLKKE